MASFQRFHYTPLDISTNEIRVVTLWPGKFDDPIRINITHSPLRAPAPQNPTSRLSLSDIQKTLPEGGSWSARETLEGRVIFEDETISNDYWTTWTHPDPSVDRRLYDPEVPPLVHHAQPDYEALSYTWGSDLATAIAKVESIVEPATDTAERRMSHRGDLRIGHNLEEAIRHLRFQDKPRVMWIDAICINQEDIQDRNEQVPRMGQIYGLARRVVAWIGPSFDGSKLAISTLDYLGGQVEFTLDRRRFPRPGCAEPTWFDVSAALPYKDDTWEAISTLFSQSYFSRLWILQEIQLGSQSSVIKCGPDEVPWPEIRRALFTLYHKDEGVSDKLLDSMYEPRMICDYSTYVKFDHLLWTYNSRACSNQRDKIYGLMNLAPPGMSGLITVDYSRSLLDVYKQTFLAYFQHFRRLDLLVQAGLNEKKGSSSMSSQWPTWLPNWSQKTITTLSPDAGFCASGLSESKMTNSSPDKLELSGIDLTTVSSVDPLHSMDFVGFVKYLKGLGIGKLRKSRYRTGESLLDTYLTTLACAEVQERYPIQGYPTIGFLREQALRLAAGSHTGMEHSLSSSYVDRYVRQLQDSYLFTTDDGYVGTCRTFADVLPDDRVFIPLGCESPLLLRPTAAGSFHIVGDCYVHGVMSGEAFLGPFPSPWGAYVDRGIDGVFRTCYWNDETKKGSPIDPRLEEIPLPPEWKFVDWGMTADDPKYCPKYRHQGTGEVINYDPRMSMDALVSRGFPIQTITLV